MKHIVNTEQKLDQSQIKIRNKAMILNAFRTSKSLKKQDLVQKLALSITTVTTNVNELLEEGLIIKQGIAESTGGRKPLVLEIDKSSRVSIGIDISPHKVSVMLMNLMSEAIDEVEYVVSDTLDNVLQGILDVIEELMEKHQLTKKHCLGVGLSIPGIVDEEELLVINAPNLRTSNYSLKTFRKALDMPLYIENEANVAALAEIHLGSAMKYENVVYVSITDGVGCGIVIGNKVYKSKLKRAGEFGHMRISDQDLICECGRKGCWEVFASEKGLLRMYNEYSGDVLSLNTFFNQLDDNKRDVLSKYFNYLSLGIENIILGLGPEQVIIGGDIVKYLRDKEINLVDKIKLESTMTNVNTDIVMSEMTPKCSVIGASLLPLIELFGL